MLALPLSRQMLPFFFYLFLWFSGTNGLPERRGYRCFPSVVAVSQTPRRSVVFFGYDEISCAAIKPRRRRCCCVTSERRSGSVGRGCREADRSCTLCRHPEELPWREITFKETGKCNPARKRERERKRWRYREGERQRKAVRVFLGTPEKHQGPNYSLLSVSSPVKLH